MNAIAAQILQKAAATGQLAVNEMFHSLQGEGPSAGQAAVFIRLGVCNLDCGTGPGALWACDTPYSWKWDAPGIDPIEQLTVTSVDELADFVARHKARRVVISGGEPMIQQHALLPLVTHLCEAGYLVEFETNGTIAPTPELVDVAAQFNVSPKLSTSGVRRGKRLQENALKAFCASGKAIFKFVIADPDRDVPEVEEAVAAYDLDPVWLLPEGTDAATVIAGVKTLSEIAIPRGWSVSSRLHILLWGDERGR
ncbi:7-carboxy-7-deazaguanine synthase QueE [Streptomyces sp. TRM66268-LWL]|uniref:7-carboxy-7-deazaguanine synthase n=1 Tax=Streptomyces polyasparticus TaxID=2767826 RepID=A0ABR7SV75_9ACTN|nr:7-carboxy-7-deazaguanine synthase QueE [Streptomyces polyasparticus]MBC9718436.1 7-carboxy-7-deazaguanine synthase QueE [Streptomyces polyasparticus]